MYIYVYIYVYKYTNKTEYGHLYVVSLYIYIYIKIIEAHIYTWIYVHLIGNTDVGNTGVLSLLGEKYFPKLGFCLFVACVFVDMGLTRQYVIQSHQYCTTDKHSCSLHIPEQNITQCLNRSNDEQCAELDIYTYSVKYF